MKITLTSVLVDDQAKALAFYTQVLGFREKTDIPLGEHRWLTVVSPEALDGVELVLEPDGAPRRQAVQDCARRGRNPLHLLRRRGRPARVRAAARPRGPLHPGADRHGPGDHRCAGRHLWEPDSDRRAGNVRLSTRLRGGNPQSHKAERRSGRRWRPADVRSVGRRLGGRTTSAASRRSSATASAVRVRG